MAAMTVPVMILNICSGELRGYKPAPTRATRPRISKHSNITANHAARLFLVNISIPAKI